MTNYMREGMAEFEGCPSAPGCVSGLGALPLPRSEPWGPWSGLVSNFVVRTNMSPPNWRVIVLEEATKLHARVWFRPPPAGRRFTVAVHAVDHATWSKMPALRQAVVARGVDVWGGGPAWNTTAYNPGLQGLGALPSWFSKSLLYRPRTSAATAACPIPSPFDGLCAQLAARCCGVLAFSQRWGGGRYFTDTTGPEGRPDGVLDAGGVNLSARYRGGNTWDVSWSTAGGPSGSSTVSGSPEAAAWTWASSMCSTLGISGLGVIPTIESLGLGLNLKTAAILAALAIGATIVLRKTSRKRRNRRRNSPYRVKAIYQSRPAAEKAYGALPSGEMYKSIVDRNPRDARSHRRGSGKFDTRVVLGKTQGLPMHAF